MDILTLTRIQDDGKQTIGVLVGEKFRCFTLELAWKNNERKISCIPKGEYRVTRRYSAKYGTHYEINNVQNRTAILIHTGNYHTDILGCILVGNGLKDINKDGHIDVIDSKTALNTLLVNYPSGFTLKIV